MEELSEEEKALRELGKELSGNDGIHATPEGEQLVVDVNGDTVVVSYDGGSYKGETRFRATTTCFNDSKAESAVKQIGNVAGDEYWVERQY